MTGVLPVAMSTIMVSPTARPKPIMMAEKMPGLAVGSTIRIAVCQRLAPRASEPARRCWGTLASESSAMVKMIGITAKPMATPDHERVALVVGQPQRRQEPAAIVAAEEPHLDEAAQREGQPRAPRRTTGISRNTSAPGRSRLRERAAARARQSSSATRMHTASTSGSRASPGTIRSTMGASHRPARKPSTTLGSAAMISTTGLTYALTRGVHELAHVERGEQRQRDGEQQRVERALERAVDQRGQAELGLEVVGAARRLPDVRRAAE